MLISSAYAQDAAAPAAAAGPDLLTSMAPLLLIFVVFYFLLIRPQQKRAKEHRATLGNLRRGDRVVTGGGFVGLVTKVISNDEVQVEIADGVRVRVIRATITSVLSKTEPAKADAVKADEKDTKGA